MKYIIIFLLVGVVTACDKPTTATTSTTSTTTTINFLPTSTSSIMPAVNPKCGVTHYPPNKDGFLWKPVSESNGKLVVLLPHNFKKKYNTCKVYDGKVADSCFFSSWSNPDRQTWRCPRKGSDYNAPALVVCNDGIEDCAWHIPTPSKRVE